MVVYNLLVADLEVIRKQVVFREHSEVSFLIRGEDPFIYGVKRPYPLYDISYKVIMVYQISTAQMINSAFVLVDEVVDLLR